MARHARDEAALEFTEIFLSPQVPDALPAVEVQQRPIDTDFARDFRQIEQAHGQ